MNRPGKTYHALLRMLSHASDPGALVDMADLCRIVASRVAAADGGPLDINDTQASVLLTHVRGPSRASAVCDVRHTVAAVLRGLGWSFPQIGRALDRDHTSIMHAVKRVDESPVLRQIAAGVDVPYLSSPSLN